MNTIVLGFGFFITLIGVAGLVAPQKLRQFLRDWGGQQRFLFAVIVRLAFGALLLSEVAQLRFPHAMKIIGAISFGAGIVVLLMGQGRLDRLVSWWLSLSDTVLRASVTTATLFGLFLIFVAV